MWSTNGSMSVWVISENYIKISPLELYISKIKIKIDSHQQAEGLEWLASCSLLYRYCAITING